MKIKLIPLFVAFFLLLFSYVPNKASEAVTGSEGVKLKEIDIALKHAFYNRMTDPQQTVIQGKRVLARAEQINYAEGMAEANRVIGIGYYYMNKADTAIDFYLVALSIYKEAKNQIGQAKVLNNIGNLYLTGDYDQALNYYSEALNIALKVKDDNLIGTSYLNVGNIYYRKKNFYKALQYYDQCSKLFSKVKDTINMIQCLQNTGVVYYRLRNMAEAKELLLQAHEQARVNDLNTTLARIDLTLTSIFITGKDFANAEKYWQEGLDYSELVKNPKLVEDYKYTRYELLMNKADYKDAVYTLREIYQHDSVEYKNNSTIKLTFADKQYKQLEREHENEATIERQKYNMKMFWASTIVACLLLVVIVLLVNNVNRKAQTNARLTELNTKISEQKEHLNRVNQHLEDIIDERTKDLRNKNKKLSDYSSHLSHQIRGPIATLKGLLNLEKDDLIDPVECIKLMNKCVGEIDDNIIDMSSTLHSPDNE